MTHHHIRKQFIDYFVTAGHKDVPAASLVPDNDPTVLFTVAGMQQFKDCYAHPETAPAARIVTIQPCIRTIDIDEVGDDTHNTVFEMLGNFSFGYAGTTEPSGPYFKEESLRLSWEFLTQQVGIEPERIYATIFSGDAKRPADSESQRILESFAGLTRIESSEENFWGPVGDSGPCGPCVEFYVDGIEIWNNVFNQYNKDAEGTYTLLDQQGVDTGMGLERLVSVLQGKQSVYDTDLLHPFVTYVTDQSTTGRDAMRQVRIIVDHTKAALYLLCDGVKPGNKGRDYILRRLIRRAVRAGQTIGFHDFESLLEQLAEEYGPYRSSISTEYKDAVTVFVAEQDKFLRTLQAGMSQLKKIIGNDRGGEITGDQAFKLFDTFGFPIELTAEIAQEYGWTVDETGFAEHFKAHREQSRAGSEKIFQGGLADHEPQTVAHHTAHHLLLAALRHVLGNHVVQRGSNITSERLRIDVAHPDKITDEQLQMVEAIVNQKIAEDLPVINETMDRDVALASGALAEFGTKYPKEVSVYSVIDQDGSVYSRELCGGPHVTHTSELGQFEILKEEASSAGIRRIRARLKKPA
jgi:alanyl-tRNA synthetase